MTLGNFDLCLSEFLPMAAAGDFFYLQPYEQKALDENDRLWPEGAELFLSQKLDTKSEDDKRELLGTLPLLSSANLGLLILFISGVKPIVHVSGSDQNSQPIVYLKRAEE